MILVTLGTNDKPFTRLLSKIEALIESGDIQEKVIVQAGYTQYSSERMQIFDLIPMDMFDELISKCSVLITHGGVGTIITGLKHRKKVIAVPRLAKYEEHVNDHQLQIIRNFDDAGYIIGTFEVDQLEVALGKVESFEIKTYESNTTNMINLVRSHIEND